MYQYFTALKIKKHIYFAFNRHYFYNRAMASRKKLGPKIKKNTSALKRFILWAVIAAFIGGGMAGLAYYLIGLLPAAEPEEGSSLLRQLPGMILLVTLFF